MVESVAPLVWADVLLEEIDLPGRPLQLTLGLGSGLTSRDGRLFAVTDRGPNLFISQAIDDYSLTGLEGLRGVRDAKVMPCPANGPEIVELGIRDGVVSLIGRMPLRTASGERFGGAPPPGVAEPLFDLSGQPLPSNRLGADTEAIAAMPDGGFFVAEEYAPSLLKVDALGLVRERWAPSGNEAMLAHTDVAVRGVLPARAAKRRTNRGIEGLCASADGRWLYAGFQSALAEEDQASVPIWKLDASSGELAAEWLYPFDDVGSFLRDAARRKVASGDLKICEMAWIGEDRLVVLERVAHSAKLYAVDLARLPQKRLILSTDDYPEISPDLEGMTLLSPTEILLVSDNDFGVEGACTAFWRVTLDDPV